MAATGRSSGSHKPPSLTTFIFPQVWIRLLVELSHYASVIFAIAGCQCLLMNRPDTRYSAISDKFEDIDIILGWSGQIRAEDYQVEEQLCNVEVCVAAT